MNMTPPKEKSRNTVPQNFYKSNVFLVRIPWLAYGAYTKARDSWVTALPPPEGKLILDIGCSRGETFAAWADRNTIIGLDCEESVLGEARGNGLFPVIGDMRAMPFPENHFDVVCGLGVLGILGHHAEDLRNFYTVLKPGGRLLLSVAILGGVRTITRSVITLLKVKNQLQVILRLHELEKVLQQTGFEITSLTTTPLVPPTLHRQPGKIQRTLASYAFIEAVKIAKDDSR